MTLFWIATVCVAFVVTQIIRFEMNRNTNEPKADTQMVSADTVILDPETVWVDWSTDCVYHDAKRTKTVRLPTDW